VTDGPYRSSCGYSPDSLRGGPGFERESIHVGSVVDRTALGHDSSEHFGLPCHSFSPLTRPQTSPSIIEVWYNTPINCRGISELGSSPDKLHGL
jgi:hypothetical protein